MLNDTHLGARWPVEGAPRGWSRADDPVAALEAALAPALRGWTVTSRDPLAWPLGP